LSATARAILEVCNHTFRGTGITAYLENGGTLTVPTSHLSKSKTDGTRLTACYQNNQDFAAR